jgi:hypothetical protein
VYLEIPKKKQRPHYGGSRMDNYFSSKDILDKAIGTDAYFQIKSILFSLKAADVAEVRHGRWIFEPGKIPYCSECKKYSDDGDKGATFCPWCGARMGEEDEHEAD